MAEGAKGIMTKLHRGAYNNMYYILLLLILYLKCYRRLTRRLNNFNQRQTRILYNCTDEVFLQRIVSV